MSAFLKYVFALLWLLQSSLCLSAVNPLNEYSISLKTGGGYYFVAEDNGGNSVNASRSSIGEWERFTLIDLNGDELRDGDKVNIKTGGNYFFQAVGNGGGDLNATASLAAEWETFTILKPSDAGGIISSSDKIALRTGNGKYLQALSNGGDTTNASATTIGCNGQYPCSWEVFELGIESSTEYAIKIQTGNGNYFVAENNGGHTVNANRVNEGPWEWFSLIDLNGNELRDGDKVHIRTGSNHYFQATGNGGGDLTAAASAAGEWETFTILKPQNPGGVVSSKDKVSFQAGNGQYFQAVNNGGSTANVQATSIGCNGNFPCSWEVFELTISPILINAANRFLPYLNNKDWMTSVFGHDYDEQAASHLASLITQRRVNWLPKLRLVDPGITKLYSANGSQINQANSGSGETLNGAYKDGTIYFSSALMYDNANNDYVSNIAVQELAHHIEELLNPYANHRGSEGFLAAIKILGSPLSLNHHQLIGAQRYSDIGSLHIGHEVIENVEFGFWKDLAIGVSIFAGAALIIASDGLLAPEVIAEEGELLTEVEAVGIAEETEANSAIEEIESCEAGLRSTIVQIGVGFCRPFHRLTQRSITHVRARHFPNGAQSMGKSLFDDRYSVKELVDFANSAPSNFMEHGGDVVQFVDAEEPIGETVNGVATNFYKVVTAADGEVITLYPILGP